MTSISKGMGTGHVDSRGEAAYSHYLREQREFLFLNRVEVPTADEHEAACAAILAGLSGRTATLRTFDLGSDKLSAAIRAPLAPTCRTRSAARHPRTPVRARMQPPELRPKSRARRPWIGTTSSVIRSSRRSWTWRGRIA